MILDTLEVRAEDVIDSVVFKILSYQCLMLCTIQRKDLITVGFI